MTVRLDGFAFMRVSIYQEDYRGQPRPLRREKCLRYAEFFRQMADEMPPREMLAGDIGVADSTLMHGNIVAMVRRKAADKLASKR